MNLHPASRLAAWIGLAAILPWLAGQTLAWLGLAITVACLIAPDVSWQRYLRRSSVLLISIVLVYGLATPGQPVWAHWNAPSIEGLHAGLLQAARLAILLLALALVLSQLSREQLFAGVYTLLAPLRLLGVPVERLAGRLWLTVHYADTTPAALRLDRLDGLFSASSDGPSEVTLTLPPFGWHDAAFAACCAIVAGVLLA